jgi:hypothetical protein
VVSRMFLWNYPSTSFNIPKDQCQQPKARRAIDFSTAYVTHLVCVYCARRMRNDDFSPMS